MKFTKRKLFVAALCISLVAILSVGTLAWFSAEYSVKNDFFFADSNQEPDDVFSIKVVEERDDDGDGIADGYTEEGFEYTNIIPGDKLSKIVHIQNTGIHTQYVRLNITVSAYSVLAAAWDPSADVATALVGFDSALWLMDDVVKTIDTAADTITYTLYYADTFAAGDEFTAFTDVIVPTGLTVDQAQTIGADGFSITVLAEAVQAENLGVTNAIDAFALVNP